MAEKVEYIISIKDQFSAGLKSAESSVNKLEAKIKGVGSSTGGLLGLAAKIGGAFAIFEGIKGIVKMGANMEQTRVSFTTMLGSAEKATKVIADLNKFANVTPFDNEQTIKAGQSLTAFGVSSEQLIPTLKTIGDIASGTGKDFNELTTIYGKAKIAGTLYAEDINQLIEAGIPIISEFSKQLGVPEASIKKLASQGKISFDMLQTAFKDMSNEGGQYANLMDKQSKTLAGRWSSLVGTLQTVGVRIGESLIEPLGKVVDYMSFVVDWMITNWNGIKQVFQPLIGVFNIFRDSFQSIIDKMGVAGDRGQVLEKVFNVIGTILSYLEPIITAIAVTIAYLAEKFWDVIMAVVEFIKRNEWLQKTFMALYKGAVTAFTLILQAARNILGGIADLLIGIFTLDPKKIKKGLQGIDSVFKIEFNKRIGDSMVEGYKDGFVMKDFFSGEKTNEEDSGGWTDDSKSLLPPKPPAGGDKKKGLGSDVGSISHERGANSYNITINKLVETLEINTTNLSEGTQKIKDEIQKALLTALNDVQTIR